ncbi:wings apart-like protein homolog isoform X2 [Spea bombifrons]|uniref:wings apart-like protein homolog isoform X2 n=1 Tax=Spea bombifrons TaxID=233779 RepID=UPI00234BA220|nr:wings apart-like protein homolog isoform X2 [Spea bombifrons]
MTSRFGKTYSRKGGNGSSKFDEVFSNKRTTLSTKWGETTFMAKLGQKRPNHKPDVAELPKKPKVDDDIHEDPFGFDSDEDSLPISSKNVPQAKSAAPQPPETDRSLLEANNKIATSENPPACRLTAPDGAAHGLKEKNTNKIVEEGKARHGSPKKNFAGHLKNFTEERNSFSVPKNADSDVNKSEETLFGLPAKNDHGGRKPAETLISSFAPDSDWDLLVGRGSDSPSPRDPKKETLKTVLYDWEEVTAEGSETSPLHSEENSLSEFKNEEEKADGPEEQLSEEAAQGAVKLGNCRTYCRSNKSKQPPGSANFDKILDGSKSNSAAEKPNPATKASSAGSRAPGRTRDYTVLHPSCLSVCNVTIQDSMDRSIDEFAPTTPATDLGEAGRLRKKADVATTKAAATRFRPGNVKSKKDAKLEFFGFDDQDDGGGEEGGSRSAGQSNYRIKYFGFDDLSESDDDDDEADWPAREKKTKKKSKMAAVPSPPSPQSSGAAESLPDSQSANNSDLMEDPYAAPEVFKKPASKQGEKTKDGARKIFSGPKRSPTKAVYNARHWNQPESEELPAGPPQKAQTAPAKPAETPSSKDDGLFKAPAPPPRVIKTVTIPTQPYQDIVTTLKCRKEHKELYTVVQHVKHFNDVVEFGENQEFTDDIEYLLSGLKSSQPINTRCLSVISLATKCAMPSFRMHLRAHGMVAMVFKTLDDSQHHQNLALCTAALMYILSRDRLNMDLDRASLDLMIRLLEMEQDPNARLMNEKEMNKIKEKIRKLCETVHNKHLDLENITAGHLAMETLLSLTSKRAGDWFKEELRLLGGLDHIVDKVKECVNHLDSDENEEKLVASLWGAERCLRVLESVTVHNPENQSYLIAYKDSQLIVSSAKALRHCEELIQQYNRAEDSICIPDAKSSSHRHVSCHVGKAVEDCMRAIIGVLLNLTNDNEWGSTKTGEQDNLISTALNCVLQVPKYLPQEQRFDIRVLGLGLLINLVEYSARNRHCLVNMETTTPYDSFCGENEERKAEARQLDAVEALVQLFLERERAAQVAESQTDELIKEVPTAQHDKSGEWQESGGEIQWVTAEKGPNTEEPEKKEEEDEELDLNKALQHAGKHMEDCIVASYTALLLGCLCQESPINVTTVRNTLPDGDFTIMTEMLKKFLSFMNLTCAVGTTGQKSISRVIDYLEHC